MFCLCFFLSLASFSIALFTSASFCFAFHVSMSFFAFTAFSNSLIKSGCRILPPCRAARRRLLPTCHCRD